MIIKLRASQKVTAGLRGGKEGERDKGKGGGERTRTLEGEERKGGDKRMRMRVWER